MDMNIDPPKIQFHVDTEEAEKALLNLSSAFLRNTRYAMETATDLVQAQARAKHKFRSRSNKAEESVDQYIETTDTKTEGVVWLNPSNAPYVVYLHEGTGIHGPKGKPYDIFPKNKKSLRFVVAGGFGGNGQFVFAKHVKHPGIKGEPFLYNALAAKKDEIKQIFADYYERTIKEAGLE